MITEYLKKHLDASLLTGFQQIRDRFDKTAGFLFRNGLIEVDDTQYRITEIEFYYYREGVHEDPFVHKHENQLEMGVWYFHNVGQDLTFGDGTNYGGILIRGVLPLGSEPDQTVDGPVRSYEKLFNAKLELDAIHRFGISVSDKPHIRSGVNTYRFPRSGLYPQGKTNPGDYILLPYRYMLYPWHSRVERHVLYLYLKYFVNDEVTAGKLLLNRAMIKDYESAFAKGLKINEEEKDRILSGELNMNVDNKCRLMGYYKMHGRV